MSVPASFSPMQRRVYVHLSHGQDVRRYADAYAYGLAPDRSPYGFHLAAEHGYLVTFSQDRPTSRIGLLAQRALKKLLGFDPVHAFYNRAALREADIAWTMLEVEALALASLMWLRLVPQRPLLGSTVWMIERWHRYGPVRRSLYRRLVAYFSEVLVHTEPCRRRAQDIFPNARVRLLPFGIAANTFEPRTPSQSAATESVIHIVAPGNDHTRDWDVLLRAFGNDPRFVLTIVCTWVDRSLLQRYANLRLPRDVTMDEFRAMYANATFLAVPQHDNIFSGITVALEAAAMRVPVIATRTGGVPTYFDDGEVKFVPVGDADAWREAALSSDETARATMADGAFRRLHREGYTTRGMIARYAADTDALLGGSDAATPAKRITP